MGLGRGFIGMEESLDIFNKTNKILVIGVSRDRNKFGSRIFYTLLNNGYNVYGYGREDLNERIFSDINKITDFDLAIIVIPPTTQKQIIEKLINSNIKTIWFQPGSESEDYIKALKSSGKNVIYNACFIKDGLKIEFSL